MPAESLADDGGPSDPSTLWARALGALAQFRGALRTMRSPRVWSLALFWSCVSDLMDAAMIGLCLAAVGIHVGIGIWLLVLLAVNASILVPATPGQIGILEAAAVACLHSMHVGVSEALAFALLYHCAHVVPIALAGSIALLRPTATATRAS